jgi:hypothetical protein
MLLALIFKRKAKLYAATVQLHAPAGARINEPIRPHLSKWHVEELLENIAC